jgi:heme-degrading monooxygenase HmoA
MIAVLVHFRYESEFDEARVRQVADAARTKFEGMPGLRSKAFTVDTVNREALNFYVWDSEEAAKAFFSPELIERVTELYGVRPTLQFLDVVALVENRTADR